MNVMIISDLCKRENIFKCNWCINSFTCYLDKLSLCSRVISSQITKINRTSVQEEDSLKELIIAGGSGSKTSSCS